MTASFGLGLLGPIAAQDGIEADVAFGAFGPAVGEAAVVSATQDGLTRVLVDGRRTWSATEYQPATGEYRQVFVSPYSEADVRDLQLADLDGDQQLEILVLREDGVVTVRDFASFEKRGSWDTGRTDVRGMATADFWPSPGVELAVISEARTQFFDNAGVEVGFVLGGGEFLDIGQVDDDSSLELVTEKGAVVDLRTGTLQWQAPDRFGQDLELADVDGDGREEILSARGAFVRAFDVELQSENWSISVFEASCIHIDDIDRDGQDELLIGERQSPEVHCYDLSTQSHEWTYRNRQISGDVAHVTVADTDHDGTRELVMGTVSRGYLFVVDGPADLVEWQSSTLDHRFHGPAVGDLDGDGALELVLAVETADVGGSGRLIVLDAATHARRGISPPLFDDRNWNGTRAVTVADLDHDGADEIIVAGDDLHNGRIDAWRFDAQGGFTRIWTIATQPEGSVFVSVAVTDLNGDGNLDVLGGVDSTNSGFDGYYVYAYDGLTGDEIKRIRAGGPPLDLVAVDLNGDAGSEIAFVVQGGDAFVYADGGDRRVARIRGNFDSLGVFVPDWVQRNALVLGGRHGELQAHIASEGVATELWRLQAASGPIDGVGQAPGGDLLVGTGGSILHIDRPTLKETARTAPYGPGFGATIVFDPQAGRLLSAGWTGLFEFRP